MAKNLRAKIPKTDKLVICDRNNDATDRFIHETGAGAEGDQEIEVVKSPRKVAEQAVSHSLCYILALCLLHDEHVLSMI